MIQLTSIQAELLRLFFANPEKSFYLHEIGRVLGRKPGSFQRAINKLADEKILTSEYRANARYFQVNRNHPLNDEITSIVLKTVGAAGSIRDSLRGIPGLAIAIIYGSYARGKENYLSDIDLLLVGTANENAILRALGGLEKRLGREINYKLYTPEEIRGRVRKGDAFFASVREGRKIYLIGDDSELEKIVAG
ncbi:MAG: nucleotidyltransferase domain-containing protein [Candidatus Aureabacteria bacterium]|nr:nucleotidyltransferase domain-containing protein [Candidatus Auribacterota bacterium]